MAKKSRKAKRGAPARKKKGMGFEIRCGPTVTRAQIPCSCVQVPCSVAKIPCSDE
jgi:hypothetical protein